MSGTGKKVKFHGAFKIKEDAVRKEKQTPGAYIEEITVRGQKRFAVITRREK